MTDTIRAKTESRFITTCSTHGIEIFWRMRHDGTYAIILRKLSDNTAREIGTVHRVAGKCLTPDKNTHKWVGATIDDNYQTDYYSHRWRATKDILNWHLKAENRSRFLKEPIL